MRRMCGGAGGWGGGRGGEEWGGCRDCAAKRQAGSVAHVGIGGWGFGRGLRRGFHFHFTIMRYNDWLMVGSCLERASIF